MKPSSTSPVHDGPAVVRAARFDRPLYAGADGAFGDAEVERRVRTAVEQGRAQGRAEGYAAGWAQGRQAAAEQAALEAAEREAAERVRLAQEAAHLQHLVDGLRRAAAEIDRTLTPAWEDVADTVTDGALALARAAIGHELTHLDGARLTAVRAAVRALAVTDRIDVHLHPQDHAALVAALAAPAEGPQTRDGGLPEGVRLVPDPALELGEMRAATPTQRLRMHLPTALAAAEEVLRG